MSRSSSLLLITLVMFSIQGCKGKGEATVAAVSAPYPNASAVTAVAPAEATGPRDNRTRYSELRFFRSLVGRLEISLSEPAKPVSDKVANLAAPRGAKIESLRLVLGVFDGNAQRELTAAELDSVALRESRVALSGESGKELEYDAPNGEYFTVRDLIRAVERAETALRADSEWLGGIDVHHIYFEGLEMTKPGHFQVMWGS